MKPRKQSKAKEQIEVREVSMMDANAILVAIPPNLSCMTPRSILSLGVAVLYEKLIIVAQLPGARIPVMLKRIATVIIEIEEGDTPDVVEEKATQAMRKVAQDFVDSYNAENN
jgi:hypothetical protein